MYKHLIAFPLLLLATASNAQDSSHVKQRSLVLNNQTTTFDPTIPADFATRSYGFFCRKELQMEKQNIPVHFRLGSMEECNRLENKQAYNNLPTKK